MGDDAERPEFGYGKGGRPLWTVRDRDAERIREVLRRGGHREFSERSDGFVVEGANASLDGTEPFSVTCTDESLLAASELDRCSALLRGAGFHVVADPDDDQVLEVWPAPGDAETNRPGVLVYVVASGGVLAVLAVIAVLSWIYLARSGGDAWGWVFAVPATLGLLLGLLLRRISAGGAH